MSGMQKFFFRALLVVMFAGGYYGLKAKSHLKENASSVEAKSIPNLVSVSEGTVIQQGLEPTPNTGVKPLEASLAQAMPVRRVARFADAYEECRGSIRCDVSGDPWKEYLTIKDEDRDGVQTLAILNYLMGNLDRLSYRDSAKKIIHDSFREGTQLYHWYLGEFYYSTGERSLAKQTYDQYRKKFKETPELVNWGSVGNFYYDTGDLFTALECYQNELLFAGRRGAVKEDVSRESLNFLEDRVIEIKKRLDRQ